MPAANSTKASDARAAGIPPSSRSRDHRDRRRARRDDRGARRQRDAADGHDRQPPRGRAARRGARISSRPTPRSPCPWWRCRRPGRRPGRSIGSASACVDLRGRVRRQPDDRVRRRRSRAHRAGGRSSCPTCTPAAPRRARDVGAVVHDDRCAAAARPSRRSRRRASSSAPLASDLARSCSRRAPPSRTARARSTRRPACAAATSTSRWRRAGAASHGFGAGDRLLLRLGGLRTAP